MHRALGGIAAIAVVVGSVTAALAQSALPDPTRTPGAVNPAVTQGTIRSTICVSGWTRTVRPSSQYTSKLKREQLRALGYADQRPGDYHEDHLVPLSLGGSPDDVRNLWPEPLTVSGGWSPAKKDRLENALNRLVCAGRLSLADARAAIAADWISAYNRYVLGK